MENQHMKQHLSDVVTDTPAMKSVTLTPVGIICSEIKEPTLRADEDGLSPAERNRKTETHRTRLKTMVSEIVINPALSDILDGIEGFSHILVLYWPHLVPQARRNLQKVHPRGRKDIPRQGIFATCSPARPNPVLVTAVRLLERKKNILRVQGLEAVDDSPVLDIKPYNPGYYHVDQPIIPDWMKKLQEE